MTTWLISRHPGAIEWVKRNHIAFDRHLPHLDDPSHIQPGDTVMGSLPVHLAARVCARGASYWNLSLRLPEHARGRELSADELIRFEASLEPFDIRKLATPAGEVSSP